MTKKICKHCKYFIDDSDKIGCSKIYIDLEAINREYGIDKFGCSFFSPKIKKIIVEKEECEKTN